jgi:hypothetical protein
MAAYVHARHAGDLPYPSPQLLVARSDNEAPPICHHLHETIVSVTPLAPARYPLEPRVLRQPQSHLREIHGHLR